MEKNIQRSSNGSHSRPSYGHDMAKTVVWQQKISTPRYGDVHEPGIELQGSCNHLFADGETGDTFFVKVM